MAAYASSVTTVMSKAVRVSKFGMLAGEVDVSNYNSTRAKIAGIADKFKSIIGVTFGTSDTGFIFEWIDADEAIKAWYFDYDAGADGAAIEAATDTDAGSAHFIAFGLLS